MTNVFVLLLAVAAPVPPLAAPAPSPMASVSAGQAAYEQNCATCHGGDLRGGARAFGRPVIENGDGECGGRRSEQTGRLRRSASAYSAPSAVSSCLK